MNGRSSDLSLLPIAFPRILILSDFVLGNAVMRNTAAGLFGILTRFPFKQQTADYQIVLRFFVSYPFNSGLKYSKGLCQYFWFYNSNALSFSRKSYIPIVVIPASLRRMIMSLPTTIIFLNESSTFLKDDSSCRILFSSSIWYAD